MGGCDESMNERRSTMEYYWMLEIQIDMCWTVSFLIEAAKRGARLPSEKGSGLHCHNARHL